MINLNEVNKLTLENTTQVAFYLTKNEVSNIKKELINIDFKNNNTDYITFIFYKDYMSICIVTKGNKKEAIETYKNFAEVDINKLMFREVLTQIKQNNVSQAIKNTNINYLHFTLNIDLFNYLEQNMEEKLCFILKNSNNNYVLEFKADNTNIDVNTFIYTN